ncbi:hypothetical protein [Paenibacillus sp. UNC499MF]|uniref:hypothetical protein n=1 Tax=Paenibacillus sp. UNC499MF TaxID=1502751 RepID=UPI000CDF179D|nr:hypothetical protein [Paenibacillus sp. UNC499MF]
MWAVRTHAETTQLCCRDAGWGHELRDAGPEQRMPCGKCPVIRAPEGSALFILRVREVTVGSRAVSCLRTDHRNTAAAFLDLTDAAIM